MGRFHHLMSWNHPTDSGKKEAERTNDDAQAQHIDSGLANDGFDVPMNPGQIGDASQQQDFLGESSDWSNRGNRRSFFLPLHYAPGYDYPLIVWLHSNGFNENQIDHVMPHISLRNYIGVGIRGTRAADSVGHRFDWHHSPAAIAAAHDAVADAIDEASERFSVHSSRIVLAGYREGGTMALRIAMRDPHRVAAAVSLGGRMPQGAIRNTTQLLRRRMPMLWQWANGNTNYTAENLKTDCRSSMAIGAQVEVRQYPGDDEMDTVTLGDVDDWIMRRIVSSSSVSDSDRWASSPTLYSSN